MAAGETFQRVEKKYRLNREMNQKLRKQLEPHMKVDEYGKSTICNVYYDTETWDLVRASIEKPVYKEKMRVRSYGTPGEKDKVFLELKRKYDGVVYKRRISLPYDEAVVYINHGIRPNQPVNPQILKEFDYFQSQYHARPAMYLAYDRIATFGIEDPKLRITYDFDIRYRMEDRALRAGSAGIPILPEGDVIMEIKVGGAYPMWLVRILNQNKVYPTSFSKYGTAYKQEFFGKQSTKENSKTCLQAF